MFDTLPAAMRDEIATLSSRYGTPLRVGLDLPGNTYLYDPARKRHHEVCMVVRQADGTLTTMHKTFYPKNIYRLLTGGIDAGEAIEAALLREVAEETGLSVPIDRFLAGIAYGPQAAPLFYTYAFLLTANQPIASNDPHEHIEDFGSAHVAELPHIADRLGSLDAEFTRDLNTTWQDWGIFRAVVHRAVYDALRES